MGLDRVAWHALWPNSVISKYTDPHSQPFGGGGGGGGGGGALRVMERKGEILSTSGFKFLLVATNAAEFPQVY